MDLIDYTIRIAPGLVLIIGCLVLARPERDPLLSIALLIFGFVLIRDAMTPAGLWSFGTTGAVPWIRFTDQFWVLIAFGVATLVMTGALLTSVRLRALVWWGRPTPGTLAAGLGAGVLVAAPVLLLSTGSIAERGGAVAVNLLPALLFLTVAGNFGEEVIFRGLLQGRLEQSLHPVRAALLSGVMFAACHAFLASTVTDVGWPLLAFTLYEGLICAFLRMRLGVLPAVLAHGIGIFLISAGLV